MNNIDIKQILEQFPDCITNGAKLRAILIDTYPDAPKAIVNTLAIIVNSGIAKEIKNNSNITELEKSRWKKKLEDDYGLSEKVIESCLNLFLYNSMASQKSNTSNKSSTTDNTKSNEKASTESTKSASHSTNLRQVSQNATVGSIIKFGSYWQGASKSEGKTPIEWRVLAKDGNKALVISEYALDCKPYNSSFTDITWEQCTLRRWLNNDFLNNAFTAEEQQAIQSTYVIADKNPRCSTNPGNSTTDKVFLLSIDEAEKYFRDNEDRTCVPTAYAKAKGAYTDSDYAKNGKPTCRWWLRSPGFNQYFAASVSRDGNVNCVGFDVYDDGGCVRPALWIDLSIYERGGTTTSTESSKLTSNSSSLRQAYQNINVGSIIKFGSYWQGASTSEGKTPIEWRVLAKDGNKALIISDYALDCKKYNTSFTNVTWETCSLRRWLNNEFFNNAFTAEEKQAIQSTYVTADRNPEYSTYPGNSTTDKVFLLSINEAEKYFRSDEDRKCVPTEFAKANGAYTNNGFCWWWLRSPGFYQLYAAYVLNVGYVFCFGFGVDCDCGCVRPALWITLDS